MVTIPGGNLGLSQLQCLAEIVTYGFGGPGLPGLRHQQKMKKRCAALHMQWEAGGSRRWDRWAASRVLHTVHVSNCLPREPNPDQYEATARAHRHKSRSNDEH